MNYLLDTNIIIIYGRDSEISKRIEDEYNLFDPQNSLAVSVVTLGGDHASYNRQSFDHLKGEYIKLEYIDIEKYKSHKI